jgi:hypothetical protein
MKQSIFVSVAVLILVFAIIAPAGAMFDPRDNEQQVKRMIDDHPWGGDAVPIHDVPDRSPAPAGFIDLPFIYINLNNIIIINGSRKVNDSDQNNTVLPENYNDSQNSNPNLPARGN